MIDELRATLTRHAERVTPVPDPFGRLLTRRRRRRQRSAVVATVVVLAVLASGAWLAGYRPERRVDPGLPQPAITALLDSPTRGSLAGDAGFLDRMRRRAADYAPGIDPTAMRVLYAGDVLGAQRLVLASWRGTDPLLMVFTGAVGAAPEALLPGSKDPLQPVVNLRLGLDGLEYGVVLAPAGSRLQIGTDPRYYDVTVGTITTVARTWTDRPGDVLVEAARDHPIRSRVRASLNGHLFYDGPLPSPLSSVTATVDPTPVDGGTPQPAAASQVADILARTTGLSNKDADYRVLWSAAIPMPGLDDSTTAIVATVQAVTPDGGGPFATYTFDPVQPDTSARNHPTGSGISGDPAHSVIAMRLPFYTGAGPTDALQIIAPSDAVTAKVFTYNGSDPTTVPLDRGSGQGHLAMGVNATVVAFNANGREVARCSFVDREENIVDLYEPPLFQ